MQDVKDESEDTPELKSQPDPESNPIKLGATGVHRLKVSAKSCKSMQDAVDANNLLVEQTVYISAGSLSKTNEWFKDINLQTLYYLL